MSRGRWPSQGRLGLDRWQLPLEGGQQPAQVPALPRPMFLLSDLRMAQTHGCPSILVTR